MSSREAHPSMAQSRGVTLAGTRWPAICSLTLLPGGGWERGGHRVPVSPPWFWGASAAGLRVVRKDKREVCSLPGCRGPVGTCAECHFTTWCREFCGLVPASATPATQRAPRGLSTAITPRKEGCFFVPGSLSVIAFIGFGNQFYGLHCLSAEMWKALEGDEPQVCF